MISRVGQSARKLQGLRRRIELVVLAHVASRRGLHAWIVGGALRDRLLGAEIPEIDVAVSRDAEGLARDLEAAGLGRAVFLSKDRPGPRVFRVAGPRPIDIAEIEGGSIAADLARRDFTVNAIALALGSGELVDPFGGVEDAIRRRLHCVRPENLAEDPLRILRAARLWSTRGLTPDPSVLAAARSAAPLFGRAAAERVTAELSRLLGSERAAPALGWSARAGILPEALGLSLGGAKFAALDTLAVDAGYTFDPNARTRAAPAHPARAHRHPRRPDGARGAGAGSPGAAGPGRTHATRRRSSGSPPRASRHARRARDGAGSSMPEASPRMRFACSRAWASRAGGGPGPWLRWPGCPRAGSPWTATTSSGGSALPPDRSSASCSRSCAWPPRWAR